MIGYKSKAKDIGDCAEDQYTVTLPLDIDNDGLNRRTSLKFVNLAYEKKNNQDLGLKSRAKEWKMVWNWFQFHSYPFFMLHSLNIMIAVGVKCQVKLVFSHSCMWFNLKPRTLASVCNPTHTITSLSLLQQFTIGGSTCMYYFISDYHLIIW